MNEKPKERDFADGVEIQINSIEVQQDNKNPDDIAKVTFVSNKGKITWKPKTEKTDYREGLKVKSIKACTFDDLPEKLFEMSRECASKGHIMVKASYHVWNTEQDNEPVTYRYIMGNAMFDKWVMVKQEAKEEKIS